MAHILIIEDDAELRRMLTLVLEKHGHTVRTAENGVKALYELNASKPDLIILDLMMPLASGDTVLGYVRSTGEVRETRVLVVSAHPNAPKLAEQLEADDVLTKPVEMRVLLEHIDTLTGQTEAE